MRQDRYTRYPRAILWLLRGGTVRIEEPAGRPAFLANVEPLYIGKEPVSNLQYEALDRDYTRSPVSPGDDDPAVGIDYHAALGYCDWYAEISRKPIRLPTEVEWEYACRGGNTQRYFFGNDPSLADDFIWDSENSAGRVQPFRKKRANPFGLLGMLGGVWEWTSSLHVSFPMVESDGRRVLRGGSFLEHRETMGCGVRRAADPELVRDDIGFRIARSFRRES